MNHRNKLALVTEEEKRLLDERWAKYQQNPASALTLDQLKRKLNNARKRRT